MQRKFDRLRVVPGGKPEGKAPKRPKKRKEGEVLRCPHCGSNRFREVILGPLTDGTKTWGGTKQLRCDECDRPYSAA